MDCSHIILASQSPQRAQLLSQIGCAFTIDPVPTDEHIQEGLTPDQVVVQLAEQKARAYLDARSSVRRHPGTVLLTADTIVVHDSHIMGKPGSSDEAFRFLSLLSGTRHTVYTGVHMRDMESGQTVSLFDASDVYIRPLTRIQILDYIDLKEWQEAAGGYRIQGVGGALVERIDGAYTTVVGLPIHRIYGIVSPNARSNAVCISGKSSDSAQPFRETEKARLE